LGNFEQNQNLASPKLEMQGYVKKGLMIAD